ncbi:MAG: CDP-alcohol phosphatidyltransferase family protein [Sphingomonadales bacterium]|nr:CDP-alcohol phosphatidyltransferase family protein [Sphingomonadales bacterium]
MQRAQTNQARHDAPHRGPTAGPARKPDRALIAFADTDAAEARIAGLPAAARVVREAALAGLRECWLEAGPDWTPSASTRIEVARLCGGMAVHLPGDGMPLPANGPITMVRGEALPTAWSIAGASTRPQPAFIADASDRERLHHDAAAAIRRRYARAGRAILEATAKPTDGIVSRHINRPMSRAISGALLRIRGFRPFHATLGTAVLAALMFAALTLFGNRGLLAGALLFQAASMFDGVDGEAARSTFRVSDAGAMLDSLIDALTNLLFVLGLVINMYFAGNGRAAGYGICGLLMLAIGLTIIGQRARASAGPFTFDGVKDRIRATGSRWGQWLIWLTMRDFLAFAAVLLVLVGWVQPALMAFAIIMAGWLAVVVATGLRQRAVAR